MRASQNKAILSSWGDPTACRLHLESHKRRLMEVKPVVDLSPPSSIEAYHHGDYPKKTLQTQAEIEKVTKDNLLLAKRIFAIMEGPGMISDLIKNTDHLERHPGTLNFNQRLFEARRIHNENIALASRLDTMKPFYGKEETKLLMKMRKAYNRNKRARNTPFVKGLHAAMRDKKTPNNSLKEGVDASAIPVSSKQNTHPQHVLLEYSMIQDDRVLEVAVIKEPFRDRYVIFGIDIESGQRFELGVTSDDVSSILDGDILVTSVDHSEVWMALLQKVRLLPVVAFSKLPGSLDESASDQSGSVDNVGRVHEIEEQQSGEPASLQPNVGNAQSIVSHSPKQPESKSQSKQSPRAVRSSNKSQKSDSPRSINLSNTVRQQQSQPQAPSHPKKSSEINSPRAASNQRQAHSTTVNQRSQANNARAASQEPSSARKPNAKATSAIDGNQVAVARSSACVDAASKTVVSAIESALKHIVQVIS